MRALVLMPLLPMGLLTIIRHDPSSRTRRSSATSMWSAIPANDPGLDLQPLGALVSFSGSRFSRLAGIVNALVLVFFAVRSARARIPMFSIWALVVLAAFYYLMPLTIPGVGYLCERALPFLWVWALVRVLARVPRWMSRVLVDEQPGVVGRPRGVGLFLAGARRLDDFTAATSQVPTGARLLALNFNPHASATNTWCLIHASGMYTVLSRSPPARLVGRLRRRCPSCTRARRVVRGGPGSRPASSRGLPTIAEDSTARRWSRTASRTWTARGTGGTRGTSSGARPSSRGTTTSSLWWPPPEVRARRCRPKYAPRMIGYAGHSSSILAPAVAAK